MQAPERIDNIGKILWKGYSTSYQETCILVLSLLLTESQNWASWLTFQSFSSASESLENGLHNSQGGAQSENSVIHTMRLEVRINLEHDEDNWPSWVL